MPWFTRPGLISNLTCRPISNLTRRCSPRPFSRPFLAHSSLGGALPGCGLAPPFSASRIGVTACSPGGLPPPPSGRPARLLPARFSLIGFRGPPCSPPLFYFAVFVSSSPHHTPRMQAPNKHTRQVCLNTEPSAWHLACANKYPLREGKDRVATCSDVILTAA